MTTTVAIPVEYRAKLRLLEDRSGETAGYILCRAIDAALRECALHDKRKEYNRVTQILSRKVATTIA